MRLPLLAGSFALALAAVGAAADPDLPKAPSPTAAAPPTPATPPPPKEVAKEPQSPSPAESQPKAEPKKPAQDERELAAAYLKQCIQDWDAATHMTRKEWERTCRRVVDGRMKFMLHQMGR